MSKKLPRPLPALSKVGHDGVWARRGEVGMPRPVAVPRNIHLKNYSEN